MRRSWLAWLYWLLSSLVLMAIFRAEDRGYIPIGQDTTTSILIVVVAIITMVQVRRGRVPPAPAFVQALPLGKLIVIGAGLILGSVAWLAYCFIFLQPHSMYTTILPFTALLSVGLLLFGGCTGLQFYKWIAHLGRPK